jgi:cellulose synthase/poly-beta-1,6-N-acetylglucosamine synthase-like glycosyltransferase
MQWAVSIGLTAIVAFLLIPALTLATQAVSFALLPEQKARAVRLRARAGVLVPAHDESSCIARAVASVRQQIGDKDRLLVIADNCSDETAELARVAGAEVVERWDPDHIGKGYALDYGLAHLRETGGVDVAVVVDADCVLEPASLDMLIATCEAEQRPVQALYTMTPAATEAFDARFGAFAWRLKNWVRPSGCNRLGLPCQLMGTGMAFPADLANSIGVATGHITEDLLLGLQMALRGKTPRFCPSARVLSTFPRAEKARDAQKARWVHGHLSLMVDQFPALLRRGFALGRVDILSIAFDLLVPPLSLFGIAIGIMCALTGFWWLVTGALLAFALSLAGAGLLALALSIAWVRCGRDLLTRRDLLGVPRYVLKVFAMGIGYAAGKRLGWLRSERG